MLGSVNIFVPLVWLVLGWVGLLDRTKGPSNMTICGPKPKEKHSSSTQAQPKLGPGWAGLGLARPINKHTEKARTV